MLNKTLNIKKSAKTDGVLLFSFNIVEKLEVIQIEKMQDDYLVHNINRLPLEQCIVRSNYSNSTAIHHFPRIILHRYQFGVIGKVVDLAKANKIDVHVFFHPTRRFQVISVPR